MTRPDLADPVAALAAELIEEGLLTAWTDAPGDAELKGYNRQASNRIAAGLAEAGYVLVNADMLAEALESSEPDWFEGNGDDWAMQSAEVAAAAIFAALTRSAQKEGPAR